MPLYAYNLFKDWTDTDNIENGEDAEQTEIHQDVDPSVSVVLDREPEPMIDVEHDGLTYLAGWLAYMFQKNLSWPGFQDISFVTIRTAILASISLKKRALSVLIYCPGCGEGTWAGFPLKMPSPKKVVFARITKAFLRVARKKAPTYCSEAVH